MAFTVETGSGNPDANAYMTVVEADTYHQDRLHAGWTGAQDKKEAAIILATDYIDKRFGPRFKGFRRQKDQALEWPRLEAYDRDGFSYDGVDIVPRALRRACAEYALRALVKGELAPDPATQFATEDNQTADGTTTKAVGGELKREAVKVGPVEESYEYVPASTSMTAPGNVTSSGFAAVPGLFLKPYPAADMLIDELLESAISRDIGRG
jgi:hypothetical protein